MRKPRCVVCDAVLIPNHKCSREAIRDFERSLWRKSIAPKPELTFDDRLEDGIEILEMNEDYEDEQEGVLHGYQQLHAKVEMGMEGGQTACERAVEHDGGNRTGQQPE
jgi:hypothetical protein